MRRRRATSPTLRGWPGPVLTVATAVALVAVCRLPAWVQMWVFALAVFAGFKWMTYCEALAGGLTVPNLTRFTFLLCWPGMSLEKFALAPPAMRQARRTPVWVAAAGKTLIGASLVWLAVPAVPADAELLRGWVGMIGIIMMLHFGTFHLLALALQAAGFNAQPNMQAPMRARSLGEFWGKRWNTAFNALADRYGFRPLTPRIGPRAALAVVFLASGLLHEAVITLPARDGYGLPTAYFALQATGIFVERLPLLRHRPWLKRLFAWVVLVAPLGWLFPPVFVRNVILPMLNAIGAT